MNFLTDNLLLEWLTGLVAMFTTAFAASLATNLVALFAADLLAQGRAALDNFWAGVGGIV